MAYSRTAVINRNYNPTENDMAYTQQPGTISLWPNKFKRTDREPDFKPGKGATVTCPHCDANCEIAAWEKETKGGDRYYFVKLTKPYVKDDASF